MAIEREGTCVYCGMHGIVTDDHGIPQCLWPGRVPKNSPVVDACKACNHISKSGDDNYLRDVLVTNINSVANPFKQRLYPKFLRSWSRNQSQMIKDLRDVQLLERRQINQNTFLNILVSQPADERVIQIITRIVHGLYNARTGSIMPVTTPVLVRAVHDSDYLTHAENTVNSFNGDGFTIGDGSVFRCVYAVYPEESTTGCWVPNFYNCNPFLVFTGLLAELRAEEIKNLSVDK